MHCAGTAAPFAEGRLAQHCTNLLSVDLFTKVSSLGRTLCPFFPMRVQGKEERGKWIVARWVVHYDVDDVAIGFW